MNGPAHAHGWIRPTPVAGALAFAGCLAAAACLPSARAQVVDNWTSTSSNLWNLAGNWSAGVPTGANTAVFNTAAGLQTSIALIPNTQAASLSFVSTGGSNAYTFDSTSNVNANRLTLTSGITSTDQGALTFYNVTVLAGSQTWTNNGGAMTFSGDIDLGAGSSGYALNIGGSGAVAIGGRLVNGGTAAGSLEYSGTNTLTLTAANTYTGATTIDRGATLQLGNGTASGNVASSSGITDNGSLILDESTSTAIATPISGAGGLTQEGAAVTLTGINTYAGATTITSATLNAGSTGALSSQSAFILNGTGKLALETGDSNTVGSISSTSASSSITLASAATLTTGGNNLSTVFAGVISGKGGLTEAGTGSLTLTGANTYTGATTINAGATLQLGNGTANGSLSSKSAVADNGSLVFNRGTAATFANTISGTGSVTHLGAGTTTLTGTNSYSGPTNLNGGTLSVSADANLGAGPGAAALNMLNFNGGTLATTASFTLNGNRGMTVNSAGGTINVASGTTLTYAGLIAGTGSLSLPGSGILDLTNNSLNFGGSATVTSGELEFAGTLPSMGTLTLGNGSTLFVNGSDLSVANLVISGNATIDFGAASSILNAATFTIDAGATLTVEGWANEVDYFYAQNWTGAVLGSRGTGPETQVTFTGYPSSATGWLSYDREISPAPEPATFGAILGAICLLGVVVHRRTRPAA